MLLDVEVLPLLLHVLVDLQLGVAFGIAEFHLLIDGDEVGKYEGVDAFALIVGMNADEQEVEHFVALPL